MHPLRCSRRPDPRSSTRSGNRVLLRGLRARVWRPGHGCANSPEASTPGSSSGVQRIAAQQQLDRREPLVAEQLAMSTSTDDVSARRADHRGPAEDLYDPRGPEDQGRPVGTRRPTWLSVILGADEGDPSQTYGSTRPAGSQEPGNPTPLAAGEARRPDRIAGVAQLIGLARTLIAAVSALLPAENSARAHSRYSAPLTSGVTSGLQGRS